MSKLTVTRKRLMFAIRRINGGAADDIMKATFKKWADGASVKGNSEEDAEIVLEFMSHIWNEVKRHEG